MTLPWSTLPISPQPRAKARGRRVIRVNQHNLFIIATFLLARSPGGQPVTGALAAADAQNTRQPAGEEADDHRHPEGNVDLGLFEVHHGRDSDLMDGLVPL